MRSRRSTSALYPLIFASILLSSCRDMKFWEAGDKISLKPRPFNAAQLLDVRNRAATIQTELENMTKQEFNFTIGDTTITAILYGDAENPRQVDERWTDQKGNKGRNRFYFENENLFYLYARSYINKSTDGSSENKETLYRLYFNEGGNMFHYEKLQNKKSVDLTEQEIPAFMRRAEALRRLTPVDSVGTIDTSSIVAILYSGQSINTPPSVLTTDSDSVNDTQPQPETKKADQQLAADTKQEQQSETETNDQTADISQAPFSTTTKNEIRASPPTTKPPTDTKTQVPPENIGEKKQSKTGETKEKTSENKFSSPIPQGYAAAQAAHRKTKDESAPNTPKVQKASDPVANDSMTGNKRPEELPKKTQSAKQKQTHPDRQTTPPSTKSKKLTAPVETAQQTVSAPTAGAILPHTHPLIPGHINSSRVQFQKGSSGISISAGLKTGRHNGYVLHARSRETLRLSLTAEHENVVFRVLLDDNDISGERTNWSGTVPRTADYHIVVYLKRTSPIISAVYTITINIQ